MNTEIIMEKSNQKNRKLKVSDRPNILSVLRSPVTLKPLKKISDDLFETDDGKKYPVYDGVLCLIKEEDRGADLGDAKFYEENPFGVRNWNNQQEVEAGVEKELKEFIGKAPKEALIADVGCGGGRISNYMSLHGFTNVVSFDYSLNSAKMVNENSNNFCVWGNNLEMPVASGSFDYVISTGVIHHTPDPKKAFSECARIIKPGGKFYFKTRNLHSLYGYLFHTYGSVLRWSEKTPGMKWISTLFGLGVYRLTRSVFYSHLPKRPVAELRGKYENLFIKKLITFFTTPEIEKMISDNQLEIMYGRKVSFTHRQHFYVCRKKD